ncbi:MAG: hypothetical protein KBI01_09710 [Oscillospiraceae bacterium]|nr:hypothetical protein [Oscillospiraceae bacterium]
MKIKYFNRLALLLVWVFIFSFTACGGEYNVYPSASHAEDTEWAIYWYLCGSDLETNYGAATDDLLELLDVKLPENVKIVIETGGASAWQNDMISAEYLERYVYDSQGLRLIDQLPQANMGSEETLASFLSFAKENYPAKKTGFLFWNHGGGSVAGAAFDENFGFDALTLDEMYSAFGSSYELSEENPPFELVGFDTCLMATVDVAYTYNDIGKYLVASQELEPANGWLYSGWVSALGENPQMDGAELGKVICDTYADGCKQAGTYESITLSVTNLAMVSALVEAYDDFGKEALEYACENPNFFSNFSRIAVTTENYGGNTKEQGFTNMADLGHLARRSAQVLPETSGSVLTALENCVEYEVHGPYRREATGLSCYYSFNGDINDLNGYINVGAGEAFKYYYAYGLTGELSEEGMNYISEMDYDFLPSIETLESQGWEDHALYVDDQGCAVLELGKKANDILSAIYIQLFYVDVEQDIMLLLGTDNDFIADWDAGIFKDNFRGVWGAIDGCFIYMDLAYEGGNYNLYSVPILLNGEDYNLSVLYDFDKTEWEIQGARKPIDENGMADKNLRYLVEGDVISTIHYATTISGDSDELTPLTVDEITVTKNTCFKEAELGDGTYMQIFEMRDMQGNSVYSDIITFQIANGRITTSVD